MAHLRQYKICYTWYNPENECFEHDEVKAYGADNRDFAIQDLLASGKEFSIIKWLMFTGGWYVNGFLTGECMHGGHCTKSKVVYEDKELYRKKVEEKEAKK